MCSTFWVVVTWTWKSCYKLEILLLFVSGAPICLPNETWKKNCSRLRKSIWNSLNCRCEIIRSNRKKKKRNHYSKRLTLTITQSDREVTGERKKEKERAESSATNYHFTVRTCFNSSHRMLFVAYKEMPLVRHRMAPMPKNRNIRMSKLLNWH